MGTQDRRLRRMTVTDWIRTKDIVASNSITTKDLDITGAFTAVDLHLTGDLIVDKDTTIKGDMNFGDAGVDTLTIKAILAFDAAATVTGTMYITPTMTVDTSIRPIDIAYNYAGATMNTGVDMDCYGIRSTITQTTSNDDATLGQRGYIQGMRSAVHVDGFVDDAYSFYANMYVDGTSTANQLYGLNSIVSLGASAITMDETGNIAGVGISVNGSGDITCGGTGYGKLSGMYISWNDTNALTVDSCGTYIGVVTGATLDSGYRINASGSLTNSFHSYNSSGTPTNALNIEGAHTNAFAFPADGTSPISTSAPGGTAHYADCTIGGVAARVLVTLVS